MNRQLEPLESWFNSACEEESHGAKPGGMALRKPMCYDCLKERFQAQMQLEMERFETWGTERYEQGFEEGKEEGFKTTHFILWVCGLALNWKEGAWELQGVFSSQQRALEYVRKMKDADLFIGPVILNKPLPLVSAKWQGAFYPLQEDSPGQSE